MCRDVHKHGFIFIKFEFPNLSQIKEKFKKEKIIEQTKEKGY